MPSLLALNAPPANGMPRLRRGAHHGLEAAGYALAGLIGLAVVPALFVTLDHALVVRWSNEILDLIDLL